jgi:CDP-4-dehydro-6-deoxyglucose reductase, E3
MAAHVEKLQAIGEHTVLATLRLDAEQPLHFLAGQGLCLRLNDGSCHILSAASAPQADGAAQVDVHLRPSAWREKLLIGTRVDMQVQPGGFHWHADVDKPAILVVQGDELAPIRSIIAHALHSGWPRALHFYWGAGSRAATAWHDEATAWAAAHDNFYFTPVDGMQASVLDAVTQDFPDLAAYQVYVHAHGGTIDEARQRLLRRGVDPLHFYASQAAAATAP